MDGTSDTANANSNIDQTTKSRTDTPRFGKSTKANRARSQVSKYGKISRKNTDNEDLLWSHCKVHGAVRTMRNQL